MKHASYLELDRMRLGASVSPLSREHVASCAACQGYLEGLEQQSGAPSAVPAWVTALAASEQRARRSVWSAWLRFPALAAGLASAAAFGGWLWFETARAPEMPSETEPYVAAKGADPEVGVYVLRDGRVFRWNGRDEVRAGDRIRVNHLMPGRIDTDRVRELDVIRGKATNASPDEVKATYSKTIPLGRYGAPDEFGSAAVFLFSDAARYITGASLQVDGGLIKSVM